MDDDGQRGNPTGMGNPEDFMSYIIDQGWDQYTEENHEVWQTLYERQFEIMPGRACPEFFEGIKALEIDEKQIPDFNQVNEILRAKTGWEVVAVPGLIPDLPFFKLLSERKFPAGNFIRSKEQLDYIQEPDVFHDLFGHIPLLSDPVFADYVQAFGEGGLRANEFGTITNLSRLYWFTVEFGLVNTAEGLRIYGAGILSSPGETVFALESDSPNRIKFNLKRIMQTQYRVDDYQQNYFVVDSFKQLFDETYADFEPLYKELAQDDTEYDLSELAETDEIITHGTQEYAIASGRVAQAV